MPGAFELCGGMVVGVDQSQIAQAYFSYDYRVVLGHDQSTPRMKFLLDTCDTEENARVGASAILNPNEDSSR